MKKVKIAEYAVEKRGETGERSRLFKDCFRDLSVSF